MAIEQFQHAIGKHHAQVGHSLRLLHRQSRIDGHFRAHRRGLKSKPISILYQLQKYLIFLFIRNSIFIETRLHMFRVFSFEFPRNNYN